MQYAFDYVQSNNGIDAEQYYPYIGSVSLTSAGFFHVAFFLKIISSRCVQFHKFQLTIIKVTVLYYYNIARQQIALVQSK